MTPLCVVCAGTDQQAVGTCKKCGYRASTHTRGVTWSSTLSPAQPRMIRALVAELGALWQARPFATHPSLPVRRAQPWPQAAALCPGRSPLCTRPVFFCAALSKRELPPRSRAFDVSVQKQNQEGAKEEGRDWLHSEGNPVRGTARAQRFCLARPVLQPAAARAPSGAPDLYVIPVQQRCALSRRWRVPPPACCLPT